jgi:Holliday junction DNA helicase RuvA
MIGSLRGLLLEKELSHLLIEVNGIGYEVQIATSCFNHLPAIGKELSLYIHLVKREDGEFLYGFTNKEQKTLFKALIKISNIGPKTALTILSAMEPGVFIRHLANNEIDALERVPGIGAKTARRLIIELKDKISAWENIGISSGHNGNLAINDAASALVALGYKPYEVKQALNLLKDHNLSSEELIRLALKKIS